MRTLTITIDSDWKARLRAAGEKAARGSAAHGYQGETLNFETPAAFFKHLNERRWLLLHEILGNGTFGVRALARKVGRDVKGVHTDTTVLVDLGVLVKDGKGALHCPYDHIHIDMHMDAIMVAASANDSFKPDAPNTHGI